MRHNCMMIELQLADDLALYWAGPHSQHFLVSSMSIMTLWWAVLLIELCWEAVAGLLLLLPVLRRILLLRILLRPLARVTHAV